MIVFLTTMINLLKKKKDFKQCDPKRCSGRKL